MDSFNLPYYAASLEEMEEIVEKNGCFRIERMESSNQSAWMKGPVDIPVWVRHMRAAMEGMFGRSIDKLVDISDLINSRCGEKTQLLAVLKRI